uniref:Protein kinase domain-containing protein n=1 Tax=Caenorhabditis japonica TaxID=281687 RepID=A0A8R1DGG8_CAEJA
MHHPKETLIKPPISAANPSYSHLGKKYRFDNLPQEQSPTTSTAGVTSKNCITWRMTNAVILKNDVGMESNCAQIMGFTNFTTSSCTAKSQMQWLFPGSEASSDCNHIFTMNSFLLKRAISNFNKNRTLISDNQKNKPGQAMFEFLSSISDCVSKNPPTSTDAAVMNIFTDMTYNDLCESATFTGTFPGLLYKFLDAGFIIKFVFLNQSFQQGHETSSMEALLAGCQYGQPKAFCEIVDGNSQFNDPDDYSICLDPNPSKKDPKSIDWNVTELLLVIGIPCISLTICCVGFFVCCFKCAKLKLAMMRMNIFNNDEQRLPEEVQLKRKWFRKPKLVSNSEHVKNKDDKGWSHFASANNYMDIHALAHSNKRDVWEIDTKNLLIQEDHLLGNGAFANVFKGIVKGKIPLFIVNNSLNLIVESENNGHFDAAVKKLPAHADEQNHLDFFHEIDFMKRLGHHPHVISMLGCVSNPIEPLIVVEYCQRGDLLKFLRRHKDYVLMNKNDECPIEADMCLRIKDLVSIAWQVADGMSYLASKNFIHRDLAARNILLTKSLTAKVSDFGLCRYMDSALYTAKGGRLPIKWMSVEALKLYEFSSKSDVWSFGVLLFELFSLGDVPYPTIQQVDMLDHLLAGGRLGQPLKCPNEIYQIMTRCWADKPDERPEFNEMRGEITVMLNFDDESYGYLSVQSDDRFPKYTSLTMQDSKETAPCSSMGVSQQIDDEEYDSDQSHSPQTCAQLDLRLSERFGEEQGQEIKQIFCEIKEEMGRIKRVKSTNSSSTNRS